MFKEGSLTTLVRLWHLLRWWAQAWNRWLLDWTKVNILFWYISWKQEGKGVKIIWEEEIWGCPMKSDLDKQGHEETRFSSVRFSRSVVSDSLWPHGLQYARLPCPSPTLWPYSNSCPLNQWCHPIISSSIPFSCLQSFPAPGSFPMSQFFTSGGQSIGVSASLSLLSKVEVSMDRRCLSGGRIISKAVS